MEAAFEEELALVNKLTNVIASSLNIEEVYESFVDELRRYVTVDWASLVLIEGDNLRFRALSSRVGSVWASGDSIPKEGTGTAWVATSKKPLVEEDLARERRFWTGEQHLKQGIRSIAYLPLLARGEVFGSLILGSRRPNAYGERELRLLRHVNGQIAMPIQNAILFQEREQTLRALRRNHSTLQTMLELIQTAGMGLGMEEVFASFATGLRKLISFDEASINLLDPDGQRFRVWAISSTLDVLVRAGDVFSLRGSGTEWVISRNESFVESDISRTRRFATDKLLERQGYRAILRVPLRFSGRAFGSFSIKSRQPAVYGEEERQVIEQLCAVLGHVIWHQALAAREREERLELAEQEKARDQFVAVLAHELRTPLSPIVSSANLLAEQLPREDDSLTDRLIRNVLRGAEDLEARLSDLLDLARIHARAFALEISPLDLQALLREMAQQIEPLASSKGQLLILEVPRNLPLIKADRGRLAQVIMNLLENATKFTPEGGRIVLRADAREQDLVVAVQDSGPGLSLDEQRRLFQPYYRSEVDRQRLPGTGLGLSLCKQLVEAHGGRIWVESEVGRGSTFALSVPLEGPPLRQESGGSRLEGLNYRR